MLKTINNNKKTKNIHLNGVLFIVGCFVAVLILNMSGNTLHCYAEDYADYIAEEGGYFEDGGGEVPGDSGGEASSDSSDSSGGSSSSSGYTEEQKAAAKAWLSSHGYAPTRAGAAQAYQDYLDGKFDNDPEVRKYKGLDKTDDNSGKSSSGTPSGENASEKNSENASNNNETGAGQANQNEKADASDLQNGADDSNLNFDDMTNIIDEEVDPKQELEDSIEASKSQLKLKSSESEVMLIYDEYEDSSNISDISKQNAENTKDSEKTENKRKALMYLMFSFIFLIIFISLFKLTKSSEK